MSPRLLFVGSFLARVFSCLSFFVASILLTSQADALPRTWIGGNVDWVDGGSTANWNPADEPDSDDEAIFNVANSVNLGSSNSVNGLTLSGEIDLFTNDFDLTIDGLVQLTGASTNLFVGGAGSELNANDIILNSGATLELTGGAVVLDEEAGTALLDVNAGGTLSGHGTITFADAPVPATTLLINDGVLTALSRATIIISPPPVGTLQINDSSIGGRVDLDGATELGVVNVNRNQTLDLNVPLSDNFNGTMNLFQNSTFDSVSAWTMAGGMLNADNGAIGGILGVPAGTSFLAGGNFIQSGGTINVVDTDGTLQFNAASSLNSNFINNGLVIFNAGSTISGGANFTMPTTASSVTVNPGISVFVNQTNFDVDGANAATNTITINQGGTMTFNIGDYDPDSLLNRFSGTINLTGGHMVMNVSDTTFVMDGILNMNNSSGTPATWHGKTLAIGNDVGVLDADLNVGGVGNSIFHTVVDFRSDADVHIAADGALVLNSVANFNTVNGANNAQFTGTGAIRMNGLVNFNEAVTFNMIGGTVDFDGLDTAMGNTINIDAPVTVNAAVMESFGKINAAGVNTLDINNSVGTGVLTVNLDNTASEWTLNAPGVMNLVNDNTEATLLAGSDVNINGQVNVTGDVRITARVDIGLIAPILILTAGQPLRLAGGDNADNPNTIGGGIIGGAGVIGADTGKALHGFGTIDAAVDFDGTANLKADNGKLTINGPITDVGTIGTADVDGTLHVTNAWNNNVSTGVQLNGGTLSGGAITNDVVAGISGHGLVTARVINNTQLFASIADSLIIQTAGNDNDWDGTTNTGKIHAVLANIELRDNATFGFTGAVEASNAHTVFANGFALDFNPGSTLSLSSGGTYESTNSTDLGGSVTVGGGAASTIKVANNHFLTFQSTSVSTLNQNLRLENNNINIDAGATFSGAGAIVIPDGSHLVADNLANVSVLLDMQGAFRPGGFDAVGRIDLFDYQQADSGELFVELTGTALNAFDRLVLSGDAVIDGYLNVDIDGAFVPALGNTFNIITANTVSGTFDYVDVSGMPAGLTFHLNYLANAVQLQVVSTPFFSADFDHDGDVDATDLTIWRNNFNLNQLGDADGDNDSDGADFLLWQQQFGSAPAVAVVQPAAGAVPEPSAAALLLAAMTGVGWRRVRARSRA